MVASRRPFTDEFTSEWMFRVIIIISCWPLAQRSSFHLQNPNMWLRTWHQLHLINEFDIDKSEFLLPYFHCCLGLISSSFVYSVDCDTLFNICTIHVWSLFDKCSSYVTSGIFLPLYQFERFCFHSIPYMCCICGMQTPCFFSLLLYYEIACICWLLCYTFFEVWLRYISDFTNHLFVGLHDQLR